MNLFSDINGKGPLKRQHQRCANSAKMLAILYSLKTMEWLQNGIETDFKGTPLFSMRTESLASLESCCSIDVDAWCKRALTAVKIILIVDQLYLLNFYLVIFHFQFC